LPPNIATVGNLREMRQKSPKVPVQPGSGNLRCIYEERKNYYEDCQWQCSVAILDRGSLRRIPNIATVFLPREIGNL
jgi:hypothetical protein